MKHKNKSKPNWQCIFQDFHKILTIPAVFCDAKIVESSVSIYVIIYIIISTGKINIMQLQMILNISVFKVKGAGTVMVNCLGHDNLQIILNISVFKVKEAGKVMVNCLGYDILEVG